MADSVDMDFFEEALEEEGLTDVDVSHYRDQPAMAEVIRIKKHVGGQTVGVRRKVSDREVMQQNSIKQYMATIAAQMARDFEYETTEDHEWGENHVRLDLREDLDAVCYRCGAEVSMDDLETQAGFIETSVPRLESPNYSTIPKTKVRMTLLALLKNECEPFCPNSPRDPNTYRKV